MTMTMTVNREEGTLSWKQYELSEFRQKRKFDLTRSMEGGRSGTRGKKKSLLLTFAYLTSFWLHFHITALSLRFKLWLIAALRLPPELVLPFFNSSLKNALQDRILLTCQVFIHSF